jgi:plasmid stabilization system protein ParE
MRVRWTEAAARDLTAICDYIQTHNGAEAARKVALRIYEPLSSLPKFPHMGGQERRMARASWLFGSCLSWWFIVPAKK